MNAMLGNIGNEIGDKSIFKNLTGKLKKTFLTSINSQKNIFKSIKLQSNKS